jgi:hypothetical protein
LVSSFKNTMNLTPASQGPTRILLSFFAQEGFMSTLRYFLSRVGLFLTTLIVAPNAESTIYYSKKEALELAFGQGAMVETRSFFLTDEQVAAVERIARVKLDSKLYTFYVGKRQGALLGYAAIESHTVRTKPETLMIVLTPSGELEHIHVLAFHEPPEYQPPERWFAQLYGRPIAQLELNRGVDGITGATLSSRSVLGSARKVLALYQVVIAQQGE